jgi:hypothetical protein
MRVPPWVILVGGLAAIAVLIVVAVVAAGGGDDDDDANAAPGEETPTRVPEDAIGPAPTMTDHIQKVTPEHGSKVQQAQTIESPNGGRGICAEVRYEGLPQNNLHFLMALDGELVLPAKTSVILLEGTEANPIRGLLCHGTEGGPGLSPGIHSAAVSVQDPNNLNAAASEVVGWKFEVIE